jgi:hypothetical protein
MLNLDKWWFWRFEPYVKNQRRYVRGAECDEFLQEVLKTAKKRINTIPAGSTFWRAQGGCDWGRDLSIPKAIYNPETDKEPSPHKAKRMTPLRGRATEGRANPKGIPYLYVATKKTTAIAETRPWPGTFVTLAIFETKRPLRVVNCTLKAGRPKTIPIGTPSQLEWERHTWHRIDLAFSRPVSPTDDLADYAPTQILAELFKSNGFDGVAYRSSLGPGHNLAFFDPLVAKPIRSVIFAVRGVRYAIKQKADSPVNFRQYPRPAR